MDMQMPIMDGYAAATRLRELKCDLPIIALTANAMTGDRDNFIEAAYTEYATKPINREILIRMIDRYTHGTPRDVSTTAAEPA